MAKERHEKVTVFTLRLPTMDVGTGVNPSSFPAGEASFRKAARAKRRMKSDWKKDGGVEMNGAADGAVYNAHADPLETAKYYSKAMSMSPPELTYCPV